jgi:hypothetical protein
MAVIWLGCRRCLASAPGVMVLAGCVVAASVLPAALPVAAVAAVRTPPGRSVFSSPGPSAGLGPVSWLGPARLEPGSGLGPWGDSVPRPVLPVAAPQASSVWAIQKTPNPPLLNGFAAAVSCTGARACTAVGSYENGSGEQAPLAERWNGTAWAIQPTPSPAGATAGELGGVSCTTATACTAVGGYSLSSGQWVTLAEEWNGTAWAIQPTRSPAGATRSYLDGVSCTTVGACTAVGDYLNGSGQYVTLAEAWNGITWSIQPTPDPAGATVSALKGVSCTTVSACTAVGWDYANNPDQYVTLAERWNGTTWAIRHIPNAPGTTASALSGVSCTRASACIAVGWGYTGIATLTLAERWNGTAWAIQPTPNPAGATDSHLFSVSCSSARACTAVGGNNTPSAPPVALAERWNGTAWAIQPAPNPSGSGTTSLSAASCPAASACTAVGSYYNSTGAQVTLAEAWDGTAWAIQPTPDPSGAAGSGLNGVSCTTAITCTAVGTYDNGHGNTLAERWNGTAWAIQPTPNPASTGASILEGVSCSTASACTAVGVYVSTSNHEVSLAERWNGTAWAIEPTPSPPGARDSVLSAVSCTAVAACTATGGYTNSSGVPVTLAERWNGTAWAIQPTPNPAGARSISLGGVSCSTASACTATGTYTNSSGVPVTLAERWNGTAWAIQPTPNPAGATASFLGGVSCSTASACTAVAYYVSSNQPATLAERWNGTTWAIQPTPRPIGATDSILSGVWCTAASACTAVGYYTGNSGEVTLAEVWNGTTWAIQPTPNPASAAASILSGVWCTAASACTAVGDYDTTSSQQVTLAEAK